MGKTLRIPGTIARDLGVLIVGGAYAPGAVLEGEVAASEQRHVSRSAYREAIRILAAKGLVDSRPKMGTRVSEPGKWQLLDSDVLSWIFASEPSEEMLTALFELRRIVEPAAAALAAAHHTHAQMERMESALARMEKFTVAREEGQMGDQEFHAVLLASTANPFLISLTSGMEAALRQTSMFKQERLPVRRDPMPDHYAVLRAVAARDPAAAHAAMLELVDLARADTIRARQNLPIE